MKEATGELNMTLVTVIAISAVAAVFTLWVWPTVKQNIRQNTYCSGAYNCGECTSGVMTCDYTDDNGERQTAAIDCPCDDADMDPTP